MLLISENIDDYFENALFRDNYSEKISKEWKIYKQICFSEKPKVVDITKFWTSQMETLPELSNLALRNINLPNTSVSAERSFSLLKNILTDKRTSLSDDTLEALNLLYYNK
jgi:hypothetical protein